MVGCVKLVMVAFLGSVSANYNSGGYDAYGTFPDGYGRLQPGETTTTSVNELSELFFFDTRKSHENDRESSVKVMQHLRGAISQRHKVKN